MTERSQICGADQRFLALSDEKPPLMRIPPELSFVRARQSAGLIWLAGHGPNLKKQPPRFDFEGKVGRDLTEDEGRAAARLVGLNLLVSLRAELGSLDLVESILQVVGAINSAEDFIYQSRVLNGCTDLMVEVFGEAGRPARMAFGVRALPFNMAIEASMVVRLFG